MPIEQQRVHVHLPGMPVRSRSKDHMVRRLDRQFEALGRLAPPARWAVTGLRRRRVAVFRIPLALTLIAGGFLAILPVFGLWMIPVGLMLLAVDVPLLRPTVTTFIIRARRRAELWRRRLRRRG